VRPRLRDVAEFAGVSEATVSRVVNDRPGVAGATREEVLRALQQLGYEPAGVGRFRQHRRLVGLIVPELHNPVFPRFASALEPLLAHQGAATVLCTSTPAGTGEAEYLEVLLDHAVSGIVVISGLHADRTADHGRYLDLAAHGVPTVLVNGTSPGLEVPTITVDHVLAAENAVEHLCALGHRRIGLATGPSRYVPTLDFLTGIRRALAARGLPFDERLVSETLYSIEGGHAAGTRLLQAGATGIVCASDQMALGAVQATRERGGTVPGDVSVVGFDDAGGNAYLDPPLTSLRQPFERMAVAIVGLLDAASRGEVTPTDLRFAPELVVRASTGPAPARARPAATLAGSAPATTT
jgi:LacI family transcriptional regulator, repressor for deo operon, udp, cdd, tsx, nupC, and nupG